MDNDNERRSELAMEKASKDPRWPKRPPMDNVTDQTRVRNLTFKRVMRWSSRDRIYRIARFIWERGTVGDGQGYSAKLSISLRPVLLSFKRGHHEEWFLTVMGVRFHYRRAYGGRFV